MTAPTVCLSCPYFKLCLKYHNGPFTLTCYFLLQTRIKLQPRMIKVTVCHFNFFIAFLVITWPQYCQEAGNQFGVHPGTLTKNVSKCRALPNQVGQSFRSNFPAFSSILKPSGK